MKPRITPPPDPVPGASWIPLTKGLFALVDDCDIQIVNQWYWTSLVRPGRSHYAFRRQNETTILLHRFIMNVPTGMEIDHRDGVGWDCRRFNLRICTHGQNQHNYTKCSRPTTSAFKGVTWDRNRNKWMSKIKLNGKSIFLGRFESEIDAARRYDSSALELFGDFARLNLSCA